MDEFPTQWQAVGAVNNNFTTSRLRVLGGWLVAIRDTVNPSTNIVFVEDPQHLWVLEV